MPAPASAVAFLARRYLRAGRSFVSVITVISILASLAGIWKALRVEPNTVLSA